MKKRVFITFWASSFAQKIDAEFITKHTYTNLKKALKNPEDVYGLDLSGQELKKFPMEILQFKNLRKLNLGSKTAYFPGPHEVGNFLSKLNNYKT